MSQYIVIMPNLKEKINQIKNDHSHGSSFLLQEIIETLTAAEYSDNEISRAFSELRKIDSSMIVIHHFLKELEPAIGQNFQYKVEEYANTWKNVYESIAENLKGYLTNDPFIILTHSHSGAIIGVVEILLRFGYTLKIIQTESRPGSEGKIQAEALQQLGLNVTIITDDRINRVMNKVDYCLLGADQYDENSFVNKIGSRNIVEIAKKQNVPVFVLGDKRKFVKIISCTPSPLFEKVMLNKHVSIIDNKKQYE